MAFAVIGSSASVVRTVYYKDITGTNYWKAITNFLAWSIVEPGIGITAASLATLRPLLRLCIEGSQEVLSNKEASCMGESDNSSYGAGSSGGGNKHFIRSNQENLEVGEPKTHMRTDLEFLGGQYV